ncbi:response regulator transcription factor [Azotosporobacter soli]|uniref:response regulator transcription factor n=1 Tax=Azotosporobacter soli TaxID=3055040 RepID=UPI0031FEFA03
MRILIADDSCLCRSNLKLLFEGIASLELAEAANGVEVLELQRSFQPDILFMDITMPLLDGLATLKILQLVAPALPIVIISSLADQRFVSRDCIANGAVAVLGKPVTKEDALRALTKLKQASAQQGGDPP